MSRLLLFACVVASAQTWQMESSGLTVSLRGVSAVSANVAWASGAKGTVLRIVDGSWQNVSPPGTSDLDFRDIEAFNDRVAFAMSAGEGRASRIYKTADGGATWTLLRANQDPAGFWDAIAMWDETHGITLGDPVDGHFTILITNDGATWTPVEGPKAEKGEAAFAASGTSLIVTGTRDAWFATGGSSGGRVFHSADGGRSWNSTRTPIQPMSDGSGIFSLAAKGSHMVAVGGDYTKPNDAKSNVVVFDEGKWTIPNSTPNGYRSAIVFASAAKFWIAVGTSGSDVSNDDGRTWRSFDEGSFNAVTVAKDGSVWAVGPEGRIGRLAF